MATISRSSRVYVLDTNALLNDPQVVYSFSGAEVVVPVGVITELDKIKRQRSDRRVRFHGRKATRLLFELSQQGRLAEGVMLSNGSLFRVDEATEFSDVPEGLDLRRIDDQILALASALDTGPAVRATVVSNDLNLLLRAEVLGLGTYRFEGKLESLLEHRLTPMEWFREHGATLVLGLLTAVFGLTTVYLAFVSPAPRHVIDLPVADDSILLRNLGVSPEVLEDHYRGLLADDPEDLDALVNLANLYFDQERYLEAVKFYRESLLIDTTNPSVRTDLGIALLRLGHTVEAIQAFEAAIRDAPDHALAHYNLGVTLAQGGDPAGAIQELQEAVRLSQGSGIVPEEAALSLIEEMRAQSGGG